MQYLAELSLVIDARDMDEAGDTAERIAENIDARYGSAAWPGSGVRGLVVHADVESIQPHGGIPVLGASLERSN